MISVVIPARNAAGTIAATLGSLADDRALIEEILLVDDGSGDDTALVAREAAASHGLPLKVIAGKFGGAGAARNAGFAQARGEHVFFLDADDDVFPGALGRLHDALRRRPDARVAAGAVVRRTAGRPDKTKTPDGYGDDLLENARRYLRNEHWPIAMGSALLVASAGRDIRFPTAIGLDEDSCYWAAVLSRLPIVTIRDPVLLYNLDEPRMAERFVTAPRAALLRISKEFSRLDEFGIGRDVLQWRKAWVALRIARQLIMQRRYCEARGIMRMVRAHPEFRGGWKSLQYGVRIRAGLAAQSLGLRKPLPARAAAPPASATQRIMILTADLAFPPVSGADLRNWQNAEAAARMGPVMLVSVNPCANVQPTHAGIVTAGLSHVDEPRREALSHWRTRSEIRIPRAALPRLLRLIREFRPDVVVVEGIQLFALLEHLERLPVRLILDMHNVESQLFAQTRKVGLAERLLPPSWRAAGRIMRQEAKALAKVDRVWVCSGEERQRLMQLFQTDVPIAIVPNGIPRADRLPVDLPPLADGRQEGPVLLFVGHLGYSPNVVAAERLAMAILPLVRKAMPSAQLILAGRYPKPAVQELAGLSGVTLVDNPDDLAPLLTRADVVVVPLREGGGTRIKILEAMAWGLPVVATAVAAEGQGFTEEEDIVIAETDEELAQRTVELWRDRGRMERQRRLAHERVMQRFGPAAIEKAVWTGLGASGGEA